MAESKFSNVDEYGFQRPEDFDYHTYGVFMDSYLKTLAFRRKKWEKLMRQPEWYKPSKLLKRYIRKGVPSPARGEVWMRTSGAYMSQKKYPDLYQKLLNSKQFDTETVETIKIDLPRTFPENIYFEEIRNDLFRVLLAYAQHNKDIGYCQGLNYIAGLILIATRNDEWTFWLLKTLVESILPLYHTKTMSGLIIDIDVLTELIKIKVPEVYNHINKLGLPWAVIASKWFICIFAEVLPIETVFRIWDCIFNEGNKNIELQSQIKSPSSVHAKHDGTYVTQDCNVILFRVCITLIKLHQDEILQAEDMSSLAGVFRELIQDPTVVDCHQFMRHIFAVPGQLKKGQIDKLRTQIHNQKMVLRKKSVSK